MKKIFIFFIVFILVLIPEIAKNGNFIYFTNTNYDKVLLLNLSNDFIVSIINFLVLLISIFLIFKFRKDVVFPFLYLMILSRFHPIILGIKIILNSEQWYSPAMTTFVWNSKESYQAFFNNHNSLNNFILSILISILFIFVLHLFIRHIDRN